MEEYIKTLLGQVRCKKAHVLIEDEIRGHMEEQTEANIAAGMSREEAVKAAVNDMGDAVEAGIALDRVHRPGMAWDMVILMAVISIAGVVIHILAGKNIYGDTGFALYTVIGFVSMLVVYRIDYSFLAQYSKALAACMIGFAVLALISGGTINGMVTYLPYGDYRVSVFSVLMLYIPVYGAVLYQYYGTGKTGIIKAVLWLIAPVILALGFPNFALAVVLFFSMAVVLSYAVYRGWFQISKKRFMLVFWGSIIVLPVVLLTGMFAFHWFSEYHEARVRGFFDRNRDINYIANFLQDCLVDFRFVGGDGISGQSLPDAGSSHILIYLMASYGIVAGLLVCGILLFLSIRIFKISVRQKNQLGMMMGCGCGMAFVSNIVLNLLENTGFFPPAATFLPFFSSGGGNMLISYILVGIIMSVYRYKNVFPEHFKITENRFIKKTFPACRLSDKI